MWAQPGASFDRRGLELDALEAEEAPLGGVCRARAASNVCPRRIERGRAPCNCPGSRAVVSNRLSFCAFLAAALVSALVGPLAASAATVSVSRGKRRERRDPDRCGGRRRGEPHYGRAQAREDDLARHRRWRAARRWGRVHDCRRAHRFLSCPIWEVDPWERYGAVEISLGNGDDWASAASACSPEDDPENGFLSCRTAVEGEAGDDTLFGTEHADVPNDLSGGVGNDVVHGHGYLRGGPGRDRLLAYEGRRSTAARRGHDDRRCGGPQRRRLLAARERGLRHAEQQTPQRRRKGKNDLLVTSTTSAAARGTTSSSAPSARTRSTRRREATSCGATAVLCRRDSYDDLLVGWSGSDRARLDRDLDVPRSIERRF